jgi:hypothetical protein
MRFLVYLMLRHVVIPGIMWFFGLFGNEPMVIIAAIVIAVLVLTYPAFVVSGRLSEREEREREQA